MSITQITKNREKVKHMWQGTMNTECTVTHIYFFKEETWTSTLKRSKRKILLKYDEITLKYMT